MKTLLTIAVCRGTPETAVTDGVEFIYPEKDENQKDFLTRSAKTAKGIYGHKRNRGRHCRNRTTYKHYRQKSQRPYLFRTRFCGKNGYIQSLRKGLQGRFFLQGAMRFGM